MKFINSHPKQESYILMLVKRVYIYPLQLPSTISLYSFNSVEYILII
jgi:hypothetical protein